MDKYRGEFIMNMDRIIERINELAAKKKSQGLTASELQEQTALRQEYLTVFKGNFKKVMENTTVVDQEGNDVTPDKLKMIKEANEKK